MNYLKKNYSSYPNRMDTAITLTMKINFENFDLMALFAWRVTYLPTNFNFITLVQAHI